MDDFLKKVEEFHKTFRAPILDTPQIPSEDRCNLRINLIQEEFNELKAAIKNNDLVEIADALIDIQYILNGSFLEFGLGDKMEELFNEVHRSNMSKACTTLMEAKLTQDHYRRLDGTETFLEERDGKWFVYRSSDNKSLKSINYSPANLKDILYGSN
jgi:predicted HAD superfamily Cof-like phosphohydrolase